MSKYIFMCKKKRTIVVGIISKGMICQDMGYSPGDGMGGWVLTQPYLPIPEGWLSCHCSTTQRFHNSDLVVDIQPKLTCHNPI